MKTTNYIRFAAAAFAAIAALACSKAETAEPEAGNPEIPQKTPFTITAAFDDSAPRTSDASPETRVSMADNGTTAIELKWKANDKIYVVNENSTTAYAFTVQSVSADGKTASFAAPDGYPEGAPAYAVHRGTGSYGTLDPTSVYSSYGYALDASDLPNLFTLYAKYDATTKRLVFKPFLAVLKLNVSLPEAVSGRLSNIRIGAKDGSNIFYNSSTYDITGETPVRTYSSLVAFLAFSGSRSISGGTATVYISLHPGTELAGKQLEITLVAGDYAYTATITGGTLEAGKCYPLTLGAGKWTVGGKMYEGGTGSADDPYQIKNETNLRALARATSAGWSHSGKYFRLENDILNIATSEADPWIPIDGFNGDFNGNGKTIEGTFCLSDNSFYPGFFGSVSKPIYDLTLQGDVIYKGTANTTEIGIGAIAGYSSSSATLTNCKHIGSVSAENPNLTSGLRIGGIVGRSDANISGCVQNGGTISVNAPNAGVRAGGICGYFYGSSMAMHTSRNESNITVTGKSPSYAGALVGYNSGTVYSCSTFLETLTITVNGTQQSSVKAIGGASIDKAEMQPCDQTH